MVELKSKTIELVDVTTATEKRIQIPTGEVMTLEEYLVWLGNRILQIERGLG